MHSSRLLCDRCVQAAWLALQHRAHNLRMFTLSPCVQCGARTTGSPTGARPAPRRHASAAPVPRPPVAAAHCRSSRRARNIVAASAQQEAAAADLAADINAACNAALQLMLAGDERRAAEQQQFLQGLRATAMRAGDEEVSVL